MSKPFDDESFTLLEEDESGNNLNQDSSNMKSDSDEFNFIYNDNKRLVVESYFLWREEKMIYKT